MSEPELFEMQDRQRLHDRMLELAAADERVVAGALIGSLALGGGDRWSDLDLTFAVAGAIPLEAVLSDWSAIILDEFGAAHLFDLPSGPSIYRVFLLPGLLQFDLSFTPTAEFRPRGPRFSLLFGEAGEAALPEPRAAQELFGYAVHHALRARFSLERGRMWQAEYWLSSCRDYALDLACRLRGLPAAHGRGFDQLPPEVLAHFDGSLPASLDRDELLRALAVVIAGLLWVAGDLAAGLPVDLRALAAPWAA